MAEIILPPEENEETPQVPELNIDKPSGNSKVITIEFEAKKTAQVSTKDTNQQLYTTDTDAWFEFKETSLEGANGTYLVVFRNRHDGSTFQRAGDVVNGVAYYKIPEQEIRHAGKWRGQLVYTLENGNTTAREFDYDVKGHMLDGEDVREIVVEDFETLMSQLNSMKDNVEVELADLVNTAEQNETDRQAFFNDLVEDIDDLQANYQELLDTGVLQTNINTKLEALEEEYAPKLTEVTAQLAHKVGGGKKAELEDLSEDVLSAIEGGEGTSFNLLSIPQDKSVSWEKTTFMELGENLYDVSKATSGGLHYDGTVIDNTNRIVTDYIPINPGDAIYFAYEYGSRGAVPFDNAIFLYDKDFTYLERLLEYKSGEPIVNPTAKYVRVSIAKNIASNRLTISNKPLDEYVPYYTVLKNVKIDSSDILGHVENTDPVPQTFLSHLQGKKLVCFGDSITGNYFEDDYPSVIANRTGMDVYNVGFGGTRLGRHWGEFDKFSFYNLVDNVVSGDFENLKEPFDGRPSTYDERVSILESIDFNTVDYISVSYGANDWGDNSPDEKTDPENPTSFIGAGRLSLRKLLETFPHLRILVISPFYRYFPTDSPVTDSDEKDVAGMYLYEYVDSARQLAEEFKSPFLNAYHNLGINKYTRSEYFDGNDGTHPNPKGRKLIGETVASKMLSVW